MPRAENLNLFFKYCLNTVREKKLKKTGIAEHVQVESPQKRPRNCFKFMRPTRPLRIHWGSRGGQLEPIPVQVYSLPTLWVHEEPQATPRCTAYYKAAVLYILQPVFWTRICTDPHLKKGRPDPDLIKYTSTTLKFYICS